MAISNKRSKSIPSAREIKKSKLKWENSKNDLKLFDDYILKLFKASKYKEIEKEIIIVLDLYKNRKSFAKYAIAYVEHFFKHLSPEVKESLVDFYLVAKEGKLKNKDFITLKPKVNEYIKLRAKELGIELLKKDKKVEMVQTELSTIEIIISSASIKAQDKVNELYLLYEKESNNEWKSNKKLIKAIFKMAKNMHKYNEEKAQVLLEFCISSDPENGNFISVNNKWNPVLNEKEQDETIEMELVKNEKIVKIIPLDKQIYTEAELFEMDKKLETLFEKNELQKIIDENTTWFRKDRKWGSILISLANHMVKIPKKSKVAYLIYKIIEKLMFNSELRIKEIRHSNTLKYDILVALGKYEEAEEWNDEKELGFEPEFNTNEKIEINEELAKQDESESLFYEAMREQDIKYYYKRVDYYINDGQFKHKLGEEVSDVVIRNIKNKIAIDLKYLDFGIRELLLPHFIKIEANAKVVLKVSNNVVGEIIDRSYENYTEDMKFIMDVSKVKEEDYPDKQLFQQFILAFRAIRNHMAHGNLNLFGLRLHGNKKEKDEYDAGFEEIISLFEDTGNYQLDDILKKAKKQWNNIDIYRLPIVDKVLSYDAIQNKRLFGIALLILFMTLSRHSFLRIASEIDEKINMFKIRTVLGSKAKFYESLGLKPDWLIQLSKIEE